MIALSSLESLHETKKRVEQVKNSYPQGFEQLVYIMNLTRQLQFHYHYCGCLLTDEDPTKYYPTHSNHSVLQLFHSEVNKLKEREDAPVIKRLFLDNKECGYDNISLLVLGKSPEFLKGLQ